jgi:hypothetical protein
VYVYRNDTTSPTPIVYQLDGWHEATHPLDWAATKDAAAGAVTVEAELFSGHLSQRSAETMVTEVPAGTVDRHSNFSEFVTSVDLAKAAAVGVEVVVRLKDHGINADFFPAPGALARVAVAVESGGNGVAADTVLGSACTSCAVDTLAVRVLARGGSVSVNKLPEVTTVAAGADGWEWVEFGVRLQRSVGGEGGDRAHGLSAAIADAELVLTGTASVDKIWISIV